MKTILLQGIGQTNFHWHETKSHLENSSYFDTPELLSVNAFDVNFNSIYANFVEYCNQYTEPFNLCGQTLGGAIALKYAAEYPHKVNSLILIAVAYKVSPRLANLNVKLLAAAPEWNYNIQRLNQNDIVNLTKSMLEMDYSNLIHRVTMPTLVLCGRTDFAGKRSAKRLHKDLPNSTYKLIKKAGQNPNVESPKYTAKAINEFLSQQPNH